MLNKTNAESIAIVYGDETEAWVGKKVLLYPDVTQYQGKRVDCIRVRAVRQDGGAVLGAQATGQPAPDNSPTNDLDPSDQIPW